jgi:hypothetical protein
MPVVQGVFCAAWFAFGGLQSNKKPRICAGLGWFYCFLFVPVWGVLAETQGGTGRGFMRVVACILFGCLLRCRQERGFGGSALDQAWEDFTSALVPF